MSALTGPRVDADRHNVNHASLLHPPPSFNRASAASIFNVPGIAKNAHSILLNASIGFLRIVTRTGTPICAPAFHFAHPANFHLYTSRSRSPYLSRPFSLMADSTQDSNKSKGKGKGPAGGSKGKQAPTTSTKLRGLPKDSEQVRISKTLSWLLRHAAAKEGLAIRQDGYVQVDELVRASSECVGKRLTDEDDMDSSLIQN